MGTAQQQLQLPQPHSHLSAVPTHLERESLWSQWHPVFLGTISRLLPRPPLALFYAMTLAAYATHRALTTLTPHCGFAPSPPTSHMPGSLPRGPKCVLPDAPPPQLMSGLAPPHPAQATWSVSPPPGVLVIGPRSETISCNLSAAIGPIGGRGVARPRDGANLQR